MPDIIPLILMSVWMRTLAKKYKKNNTWLYGLLGAGLYLITLVLIGFILALYLISTDSEHVLHENQLLFSLAGIPIGVLVVWLFRSGLKRSWKKQVEDTHQVLDDDTEF